MPAHAERRRFPYTPDQLFDLVADVERYPEFLPWCRAARIRSRDGSGFTADLVIGFKMVRERYTSRVVLDKPREVRAEAIDGLFKALENRWRFVALPDGGTEVDFSVSFEFRSKVLQALIQSLFAEAVRRMVAAFEARAKALYG